MTNIAHIDLYFHLPDNIDECSIVDLLKMIIDYKSKNNKDPIKSPIIKELNNSKTISKYGYDVMVYNNFINQIKCNKCKLGGTVRFIKTTKLSF